MRFNRLITAQNRIRSPGFRDDNSEAGLSGRLCSLVRGGARICCAKRGTTYGLTVLGKQRGNSIKSGGDILERHLQGRRQQNKLRFALLHKILVLLALLAKILGFTRNRTEIGTSYCFNHAYRLAHRTCQVGC
jgi:hypothetical protein